MPTPAITIQPRIGIQISTIASTTKRAREHDAEHEEGADVRQARVEAFLHRRERLHAVEHDARDREELERVDQRTSDASPIRQQQQDAAADRAAGAEARSVRRRKAAADQRAEAEHEAADEQQRRRRRSSAGKAAASARSCRAPGTRGTDARSRPCRLRLPRAPRRRCRRVSAGPQIVNAQDCRGKE